MSIYSIYIVTGGKELRWMQKVSAPAGRVDYCIVCIKEAVSPAGRVDYCMVCNKEAVSQAFLAMFFVS